MATANSRFRVYSDDLKRNGRVSMHHHYGLVDSEIISGLSGIIDGQSLSNIEAVLDGSLPSKDFNVLLDGSTYRFSAIGVEGETILRIFDLTEAISIVPHGMVDPSNITLTTTVHDLKGRVIAVNEQWDITAHKYQEIEDQNGSGKKAKFSKDIIGKSYAGMMVGKKMKLKFFSIHWLAITANALSSINDNLKVVLKYDYWAENVCELMCKIAEMLHNLYLKYGVRNKVFNDSFNFTLLTNAQRDFILFTRPWLRDPAANPFQQKALREAYPNPFLRRFFKDPFLLHFDVSATHFFFQHGIASSRYSTALQWGLPRFFQPSEASQTSGFVSQPADDSLIQSPNTLAFNFSHPQESFQFDPGLSFHEQYYQSGQYQATNNPINEPIQPVSSSSSQSPVSFQSTQFQETSSNESYSNDLIPQPNPQFYSSTLVSTNQSNHLSNLHGFDDDSSGGIDFYSAPRAQETYSPGAVSESTINPVQSIQSISPQSLSSSLSSVQSPNNQAREASAQQSYASVSGKASQPVPSSYSASVVSNPVVFSMASSSEQVQSMVGSSQSLPLSMGAGERLGPGLPSSLSVAVQTSSSPIRDNLKLNSPMAEGLVSQGMAAGQRISPAQNHQNKFAYGQQITSKQSLLFSSNASHEPNHSISQNSSATIAANKYLLQQVVQESTAEPINSTSLSTAEPGRIYPISSLAHSPDPSREPYHTSRLRLEGSPPLIVPRPVEKRRIAIRVSPKPEEKLSARRKTKAQEHDLVLALLGFIPRFGFSFALRKIDLLVSPLDRFSQSIRDLKLDWGI